VFVSWYTRAGRKRVIAILLGLAFISSAINVATDSVLVSGACLVCGLVVTVMLLSVLVKHVASRRDPY
jgi:hypothetical protein